MFITFPSIYQENYHIFCLPVKGLVTVLPGSTGPKQSRAEPT